MTKNIFITATGTDIGKTYVTCKLIHELRAKGFRVMAIKPVISGFSDGEENDSTLILKAMEQAPTAENIAEISPWRFGAPLSPHDAARLEEKEIIFDELTAFCRDKKWQDYDYLLIEGVGGVMVPLNNQHTVRDWIGALDCQTFMVAGPYLGTLSHSFTAIESLKGKVSALIISQKDSDINTTDTMATFENFYPHIPTRFITPHGKTNLSDLVL